ncbi:MAG: hypothetical protein RR550_03785 [Rikenellaceae bacterium]
MDFLDRFALLLSPRRKKEKPKSVKEKTEEAEIVTAREFNKKRVSFAEKYFSKPEKIYNDRFVKENPYRSRPNWDARNLINILPFMKGRQDWAEWTYRNRYGVFITVGLYLSVLMSLSLVNFNVQVDSSDQGIYIDVREVEEMEQMIEQLKKEAAAAEAAANTPTNNQVSDVNSTSTEDYRYEDYTRNVPSESKQMLYEALDNLMESRQNMRNYIATMDKLEEQSEKEIRENRKLRDSARKQLAKENEALYSKKGNVTVAYDLKGRRALYLEMPAYLCEGGGKVVVAIEVNRMGKVVGASIKESFNVNDQCVLETAVWAAKETLFDTNNSAEARQKGTMTYIFIAQ